MAFQTVESNEKQPQNWRVQQFGKKFIRNESQITGPKWAMYTQRLVSLTDATPRCFLPLLPKRPVLGRVLLLYARGALISFLYGFLVDLDENISVSALLERLAEETQLPANCLELRGGFPPRELEIPSDGSIAAKEAFKIQHNDLVTVQKKPDVALASGGKLGEATKSDAAGLNVNVESLPAPSTVRFPCSFIFLLYCS